VQGNVKLKRQSVVVQDSVKLTKLLIEHVDSVNKTMKIVGEEMQKALPVLVRPMTTVLLALEVIPVLVVALVVVILVVAGHRVTGDFHG
jgi:hypothetical protein